MDKTKSSVIKSNPKPVSVFYVWYSELCRRLNINPAPAVKPAKPKCQTVLDFVSDRLKIEEWSPVISALRQDTSLHVIAIRSRIGNCQFLHDIDTEEKARNAKRKYGCIWTAYVLKQLVKSLSYSLRNTQVLSYLELDGLPLFMQYLEPLMHALKKNKTLKTLSFSNCTIQDSGCQMVCSYLRFTPNIEVLNLSGCNLSPVSGEHLAKLIKYQQINRYCESWHSSLRYENPDAGKMRGIKRITINCNPFFGDAGLSFILEELEDDLWVKALDMQKCGFTENVANRILDIVQYNKTLEIVDLRQNDQLYMSTIERVLQLLKQRQQLGFQSEFQWCSTAVTLTWSSVYSSTSKASFATTNVHKTKSAPMKNSSTKTSTVAWDHSVRKTKTMDSIQRGGVKFTSLSDTKKQVLELNDKLQKEILKRKEIEKRNEELQSQLNQIKTSTQLNLVNGTIPNGNVEKNGVSKVNGIRTEVTKKMYHRKFDDKPNINNKVQQNPLVVRRKEGKSKELKEVTKSTVGKNGFHKNGIVNGIKNLNSNGLSSKVASNNVYNILEKILNSGKPLNENIEQGMVNYFTLPTCDKSRENENTNHYQDAGDLVSNSQISLYKYMEELKTDKT